MYIHASTRVEGILSACGPHLERPVSAGTRPNFIIAQVQTPSAPHSPASEQSLGQRRASHASPCQPGAHTHEPVVALQKP